MLYIYILVGDQVLKCDPLLPLEPLLGDHLIPYYSALDFIGLSSRVSTREIAGALVAHAPRQEAFS